MLSMDFMVEMSSFIIVFVERRAAGRGSFNGEDGRSFKKTQGKPRLGWDERRPSGSQAVVAPIGLRLVAAGDAGSLALRTVRVAVRLAAGQAAAPVELELAAFEQELPQHRAPAPESLADEDIERLGAQRGWQRQGE
jgi:hypothetical protein